MGIRGISTTRYGFFKASNVNADDGFFSESRPPAKKAEGVLRENRMAPFVGMLLSYGTGCALIIDRLPLYSITLASADRIIWNSSVSGAYSSILYKLSHDKLGPEVW
jgi:hypothetical protein